jgi:hypothetical protein
MLNKFLSFLDQQGCLWRVCGTYGRDITNALVEEEPVDYLVSLFIFELTPEGFDFWNDLNNKWLNILYE